MGLLTTAARDALATGQVNLAFLVELQFSGGTERYWTGIHTLTHESQSWLGTGTLGPGSITIEASEDFHANPLKLGIVGLPGDALKNVKIHGATTYKGRTGRFLMALMNEDFSSVTWAHERRYFMDTLDYSFDPENGGSVVVGLENEIRFASRSSVKRYSNEDQQSRYSGDKGLEFLAYINSGVEVKWGTAGAFFKS